MLQYNKHLANTTSSKVRLLFLLKTAVFIGYLPSSSTYTNYAILITMHIRKTLNHVYATLHCIPRMTIYTNIVL